MIVKTINSFVDDRRGFQAHLMSNHGWFKIKLIDKQNRSYYIAVGSGKNKKALNLRENEANKLFNKATRTGQYTDLSPYSFNLIKA